MLSRLRDYLYACFSDNGSPSSTRLLMGIFSVFTVAIIWRILSHLLRLSGDGNAAILGIWLSNLPLIITALCALIVLPYTVNRGGSALTDLANMVAAYKNGTVPVPTAPAPAPVNADANANQTTTTNVIVEQPATGSAGVVKG